MQTTGKDILANETLVPAHTLAAKRTPVFPGGSEAYAAARRDLLAGEIEARRTLTELAAQRRALPPGPIVDRDYPFLNTKGDELGLIDLYGDHDTLITYFWMYGPERDRPCPMCTDTLSGPDGVAVNVKQRAAFKILGRSPVSRQLDFARERRWGHLEFVQTIGDDYARDTKALLPEGDEYPSFIVCQRDGDRVRATNGVTARVSICANFGWIAARL